VGDYRSVGFQTHMLRYMGQLERRVEILEQKGYHFLWINNGGGPELWMWDVPSEVEDQKEIAGQAYGEVLVAGYGMGVVQSFLLANPQVKTVTTVEISPEVIEECQRVFGQVHGQIVVGDFYDYDTNKRFDCVVGDIWIDQAGRNLEEYKQFKQKAASLLKPDGKVLGWGSDYFEFMLQQNGNPS